MAQRRMFSLKIVSSDAFLDMPTSSRELYFQLGMYADDDGFVNPKKIIRMIGASDDDIKVLIGKRFLLPFENGVVVVKHWLINNLIRKDFYQETIYQEEKKALEIKDNKAYTECKQNVNKLSTQYRLGKDRIGNKIPITPAEVMTAPLEEKTIEPFSQEKWIDTLTESEQPHIELIGYYFLKYLEHNFPNKTVANAELKKNLVPASYLVKNFSSEEIKKTLEYCKKKFSDVHWNLATVKKNITYVTSKK